MKTSRTKTVRNLMSNMILFGTAMFLGLTVTSCWDPVDPNGDTDPDVVICDTPECDTTDNQNPVTELPDGIYEDEIYNNAQISVTRGLLYSENTSLTYDYYEVAGNPDSERPVVLLSPGGGYTRYTQEERLEVVARNLARRGYVVSLVRYSIGTADIDTYIQSVKDMKTAIRYFKSKADVLKINPEEVFIGGWSTGANISMQVAYYSEDELDEVVDPGLRSMIEEGLDEHGFEGTEYLEYSADVKGVMVMMGYLFGETIIDAGETPLMMINHEDATLSDKKTKIIGEFEANTISQFGTDVQFVRAINQNFKDGDNLEYIRLTGAVTEEFGANYASLSEEHCDAIAAFFHKQIN